MAEPDEIPEFRTRTIGTVALDGDIDIVITHAYCPEGTVCCEHCGSTHDPGLAGVIIRDGGEDIIRLLLDAEEAAALANRLDRVVNLIYESREGPADAERELARLVAPGNSGESD
jgi:hypothetical protein